jgi:hypothetical protein
MAQRISAGLRPIPAGSAPRAIPATSADWIGKRGYFRVPDLNQETEEIISKGHCRDAWYAISKATNREAFAGKTAEIRADAKAGRIVIGINQLAKSVGISKGAMLRQLRVLERCVGLIVMHQERCMEVADPETGRIKINRLGKVPPKIILITLQARHLRPAKRPKEPPAASEGIALKPTLKAAPDRDRIEATSLPAFVLPCGKEEKIGLSAEEGGHPAAKASLERGGEPRIDAGTVINANTGATPQAAGRPEPKAPEVPGDPQAEPSGTACEDVGSGMDRRHGSWLAEYHTKTGKRPPATAEPAKRPKAATGHPGEPQASLAADPEYNRLMQAFVEARRRSGMSDPVEEKAAKKANYRAEYHAAAAANL